MFTSFPAQRGPTGLRPATATGLENILNVKLESESWAQSTLPVSKGGLGVRYASDIALPAFLSSAHGATLGANAFLPEQIATGEYRFLEEA